MKMVYWCKSFRSRPPFFFFFFFISSLFFIIWGFAFPSPSLVCFWSERWWNGTVEISLQRRAPPSILTRITWIIRFSHRFSLILLFHLRCVKHCVLGIGLNDHYSVLYATAFFSELNIQDGSTCERPEWNRPLRLLNKRFQYDSRIHFLFNNSNVNTWGTSCVVIVESESNGGKKIQWNRAVGWECVKLGWSKHQPVAWMIWVLGKVKRIDSLYVVVCWIWTTARAKRGRRCQWELPINLSVALCSHRPIRARRTHTTTSWSGGVLIGTFFSGWGGGVRWRVEAEGCPFHLL